jgi:hypothetical protein
MDSTEKTAILTGMGYSREDLAALPGWVTADDAQGVQVEVTGAAGLDGAFASFRGQRGVITAADRDAGTADVVLESGQRLTLPACFLTETQPRTEAGWEAGA